MKREPVGECLMLKSIEQIGGDKLGASDGEIGQVKDFNIADSQTHRA